MGRFEEDDFSEFDEYNEEYQDELYKDLDFLRETREGIEDRVNDRYSELEERFEEEREKTKPFLPDKIEGYDDIPEMMKEIEQIEAKEQELGCKENDARMMENIHEIKEENPYWGERFESELKDIKEAEKEERQERREHEERGEDYLSSQPSTVGRKIRLDSKIEMARDGGVTPDDIGEVVDDERGMNESGYEYFESKENLSELLNEINYEEAETILENGRKEGKYSDDNYYSLKRIIRQHYGK